MTAEQKEKRRARWRRWRERNLEAQRLRERLKQKAAFAKDPEKLRAANRKWREANKPQLQEMWKAYRQRNLEKCRLKCREYHHSKKNDPAFKAAHSARGKRNYQEKKQSIQAKHRQWMEEHPGIQRVYSQRRRALEKEAAINMAKIREWMLAIKSKPVAICYYCSARVKTTHIHFEHIIPLSRGGAHSIENLCVSCIVCNLTKGTATLDEWQKPGQGVLPL